MKIHTIRRMSYAETNIYVRQFNCIWQYLFAFKDEIYTEHAVVKPNFLMWLKWKFKLVKIPYTQDQQDELEKVMLSGAMLSLDVLTGTKPLGSILQPAKPIPTESHAS